MSKRHLAWIALLLLGAVAAAGAAWSASGPGKIALTAPLVQERINRALPRDFKGVTVEQATVTIAEDRVALRVQAHAAALGQTAGATVSARGVPRYDAARGEIFFDAEDVKVTDFSLAGGGLAERLDRLGGGLRERAEAAAGSAIALGLRTYLAERPVYRFKDDLKGFVLKAAITDIATQADAIVVTVSVLSFTETVAIDLALLLLIVFLLVQLVRHPEWGLAILDVATSGGQ